MDQLLGKDYTLDASLEVLLSAGAIGSPQILQLSGIGCPAHLASVGRSEERGFLIKYHQGKVDG